VLHKLHHVEGTKSQGSKVGTFMIEKGTLSLPKIDFQLYQLFVTSCVSSS
jgi:hypothetical protein